MGLAGDCMGGSGVVFGGCIAAHLFFDLSLPPVATTEVMVASVALVSCFRCAASEVKDSLRLNIFRTALLTPFRDRLENCCVAWLLGSGCGGEMLVVVEGRVRVGLVVACAGGSGVA